MIFENFGFFKNVIEKKSKKVIDFFSRLFVFFIVSKVYSLQVSMYNSSYRGTDHDFRAGPPDFGES